METNICITNLPAGIDTSCFGFESPVKNIVLVGAGQSFASIQEAKAKANWAALIGSLSAYVPNGLANYEVKTGDPKYNTTAFGKEFLVQEAIPSANLMLETGSGDFAELLNTLKGGFYRVYFLLQNGSIKGTVDEDGAFKGFLARVHAYSKGVQALDAPEGFYPVSLMFDDYEEFKTSYVLDLVWNSARELVSAMPFGLSITPIGSYDTGTGVQKVFITSRGGSIYTGLAQSDFKVLSSNVDTPAVSSVTDNGDGTYDLTVQKTATPVALAAGDYVQLRVEKGSPVTAVSSRLTVNA